MLMPFTFTRMGGLKFVGSQSYARDGTTSDVTVPIDGLSGGISSAPREGDLVIIYVGVASREVPESVPTPSGWTLLVNKGGSDTNSTDLSVYYKVMGSTPDTGMVISGGTQSTLNSMAAAVFVYAGASTDTPVFADANQNNTAEVDAPAITPTVLGAVILAGGAGSHRDGTKVYDTSGFSQFDGFETSGANDIRCATVGVGRFAWAAGAFDPAVLTFTGATNSTNSSAAVTLIIAPK